MAKRLYQDPMVDTIEESGVEASIEGKSIGQKIRRLRLKQSMGLIDLGQRTGLSASFLSQIETGRVVPTLRNLARICMVFGKEFSYFFSDDKLPLFRVSRAGDRTRTPLGEKGSPFLMSENFRALAADRRVAPLIADFLPGVEGVLDRQTFQGLEFVYVIHGQLILSHELGQRVLDTSDDLWIDGNTRHQYERYGNTAARALIITFQMDP